MSAAESAAVAAVEAVTAEETAQIAAAEALAAAASAEARTAEAEADVEKTRIVAEAATDIARIEAEADEKEDEEWREGCDRRLADIETGLTFLREEMARQSVTLLSLIPPPTPAPEVIPEPEPIPAVTESPPSEPEKPAVTKGRRAGQEKPKPGGLLGWLVW